VWWEPVRSRADERRVIVTGRNNVLEALAGSRRVYRVHIALEGKAQAQLQDIAERARNAGVPVSHAPLADMRATFGDVRQYVVAEVEQFRYRDFHELLEKASAKPSALLVFLDGLEDPQNLGSIARTAEFLGASGLVIRSRRSVQVTPAAERVAQGALAHLPVARVPNIVQAVKRAQRDGFFAVAAEADGDADAATFAWPARVALIIGSEGEGVSRLARETADITVRIPRAGKTPSLNAAQAFAMLAFAWRVSNPAHDEAKT
jgi:23S rRNA (guanosine2251-2'-O)-methyltransferase